jgi:hypothetical protein
MLHDSWGTDEDCENPRLSRVSSAITTPVNSDDEDEMTEDQKLFLASAKRRASRAGGQGTATSSGETDTCVARRHFSKT